jgi:predicted nucleic acid-binding protein
LTLLVDTSVIVKWFLDEPGREAALNVLDSDERLDCLDFGLAEIANVLWRRVRKKDIVFGQAQSALVELDEIFVSVHPSSPLLERGLELARQLDHSVYDCLFLAAAMAETDTVLVTADEKFFRKCDKAGFGKSLRLVTAETTESQTQN